MLVGHDAHHAAWHAARQCAALELRVDLAEGAASDVEPEDRAVVRLVAEIAVADNRAAPDRHDNVAGEVERRRLRPPALHGVRVDLVAPSTLADARLMTATTPSTSSSVGARRMTSATGP